MKKKQSKKNMKSFSSRAAGKRRDKDKRRRELIRAVESTGVGFTPAALSASADGSLRRSKSENPKQMRTRGEFSGSRSGFGFVKAEGLCRDIFIPEGKLGGAVDGDIVEVSYTVYTDKTGNLRTEGRVLSIVEEGRSVIVGTLVCEPSYMHGRRRVSERWIVIPDESRIPFRISVAPHPMAFHLDKVAVRLLRKDSFSYSPEGEIIKVLGDRDSKEANYEAILLECGIEDSFSEEELFEAERLANEAVSTDGRADLRDECIMTIDGEGARDLDDAVSVRKVKGGWRLSVHIADVSHYVRERTVLDRLVMRRGTSVYFTDKVVPMLPPALSNGACSLNAGEDKYALSAVISLDEEGNIRSLSLMPSVIRSRVRGVYSEVNALLCGEAGSEIKKKYSAVTNMLHRMEQLYRLLLHRGTVRGRMDMEIPEAVILLDGEGHPVDIRPSVRGVGERMIEEFMLAANEAVAAKLYGAFVPCVYRVHEPPPEDKLSELFVYAHNLGLDTRVVGEPVSAGGLSRLLSSAEERGILPQLSYAALRAMAKAKYSEKRLGHFGLALADYCHFTSPIRRLSDLATHRIIRRVLFEGKSAEQYFSFARRAAAAATEGELRAASAERRIVDLYRTIYMADKVGEQFEGAVSSVASHGLYVSLDNTCEGLVPLSEMPGLFIYEERGLALRSGSLVYKVGDRVRVRLEEADVSRGRLRFSLLL